MRVGLKFGDTAQHSRRVITGTNAHGQPIYAWVDRPPITGVSLQNPNSVITKVGQALVVITEIVLYVDPEIDVQDADRITVRGKTYTVQGLSIPEINTFTGRKAMMPVKLKALG